MIKAKPSPVVSARDSRDDLDIDPWECLAAVAGGYSRYEPLLLAAC